MSLQCSNLLAGFEYCVAVFGSKSSSNGYMHHFSSLPGGTDATSTTSLVVTTTGASIISIIGESPHPQPTSTRSGAVTATSWRLPRWHWNCRRYWEHDRDPRHRVASHDVHPYTHSRANDRPRNDWRGLLSAMYVTIYCNSILTFDSSTPGKTILRSPVRSMSFRLYFIYQ